ncbi:MAG TPA: FtsQ-type POTRA domain-containing protein [Vicinamibacteria bacterium]|nr:FtsQ-type POTRA domain-containing protein [Vicinamibacteria bacterium]
MKERRPAAERRLPLGPPPSPALDDPGETPFLRPERRMRARRARRGATWRAVVAVEIAGGCLVAAYLAWSAYASVMASERLEVDRVEVRGSRFLSEGEVRELLGPAVGENILGLDIESLKERLQASPWVADATVSRTLPDTLRVDIREREPLALAELERLYLMDGQGTVIDLYGPRTAGFDLPIVRGLVRASGEERRDRAEKAGALLRDLGDLAAEISEVEVEATGDLKVVLRGQGELLRMGPPPFRPRLLTFLGLRAELARRCPDAEYFDLRFNDRIFVKHGTAPPGTGRKVAAAAAVSRPGEGMGTDEPAPVGGER